MSSRYRFALAPVAIGLAALLGQGLVQAQNYGPAAPPAYGQPYGRPDPADGNVLGNPDAAVTDPPSRIATVTDMSGGLSFAPAGSDDWAAVVPNRPFTTGDRLWVDPGGRAELHAGATAVRLGGASAATILNLDDRTTQIKLTRGSLQLRVRALPPDQQVEVDTPNLAFVPREPGDYRLDVAPDGTTTLVTMRHGSAVLYGDTRSVELERGQRLRFAGTDLADAGQGSYPPADAFDQWTAARDAREDASPTARYVPAEMTGYTALDDYGDWQQDPGYGAVWFPRAVSAGWAPYSTGHWAWVAPWGWTWIDDAPWGFAPSHYGRWAYFGSRWGWVPGPVAVRPCYAPAVVGFIGGVSASIRIGGGPGVAWYPLGPRDVYRPVYRTSPTYVTRINNITVNNTWMRGGDRDRWVNRNVPGAISGMPSRNFVEGRPVPRGSYRDEWRQLPVGEGRGAPPMAPVKASLIGGARPQDVPPMARQGFARQAIAAHPPGHIGPDELARRFAREGGTAGAGPAWRGPTPTQANRQQLQQGLYRGAPSAQAMPWQPDVRMSQAAAARGHRPEQMRGLTPESQRQQVDQQRQLQEQQRQAGDFQQRQQQALQRQRDDQQRQLQDQQRQAQDMRRNQQQDLQRMSQEQQRQLDSQRRDAMNRQQFDQQRQQQEQQQQDMQRQAQQRQQQFDQQRQQQERQQQDMQRQAQQRQQQFDQQRQQQERQQQDMQRQAQQRQQQFDQQRQQQEQQRQQMDQQRQQAAQRQQLEQARQAQEQQRQQFEQQRQQAMQRQQMEQQRQAQEQQRRMQEQQQQQQQRQVQEQQRQVQEQQRQQQERQRQQQQQQQQRAQQEQARHTQQARNDERR
ncbi:DUF6600 domain-containing protein [Cupriavidus pauculus]|uniref:DUF6600 domain-containing protein n=1 Tax=Cupriavidus pauculus TaxID=82633 RepID=UPI00124495BB|nr:DUF6600 domain-containing protein [Cupriavidus pauculus]KAB0603421.1 FecR domain-containing protein [Cupriavidus pauculus]MCM3605863.1 branched-chain amino acid ABC transporter substrate-binding protein [Cupriavidus pauculus]UAL02179.1 branched-chain amino acid ABC transporter substrate-binding protein [Cupriavidus pauculus]